MLSLNTPQTGTVADSFDIGAITIRFDPAQGNTVEVVYFPVVATVRQPDARRTVMGLAAFDALAPVGVRLKAFAAVATAEGLANGTYTVT